MTCVLTCALFVHARVSVHDRTHGDMLSLNGIKNQDSRRTKLVENTNQSVIMMIGLQILSDFEREPETTILTGEIVKDKTRAGPDVLGSLCVRL